MPITIDGLGTISGVSATGITTAQTVSASNITTGTLPKAQLPAGSVLQVVSTTSSTQTGYSSASFLTINELTTSITPTSTSSKILIMVSMTIGLPSNAYGFAKFQRNGSDIAGAKGSATGSSPTAATFEMGVSNSAGSFTQHAFSNVFMYLDSPATTSSTSYSIVANAQQTGALTFYINRAQGPNGDANNISGISTMTLMEIAG